MDTRTDSTPADPPAGPEAPSAGTGAALEKTEIFHLLQNGRRRRVVRYFDQYEGPVSIGDLTDRVAAWECNVAPESVTTDERQRVYISLYQSHLEKLDGHGVVEYDAAEGTVTVGENHGLVASHLVSEPAVTETDPSAETDEPSTDVEWPGYYLGISLGGFLPVVAHVFQLVPAELLSLNVLNVVVVAAYVLVACFQFAHSCQS